MTVSEIKNVVNKVFSKEGFRFLNFSFVCPNNIDVTLKKDSNSLNIDFTQEMPYIKVKKMLIPMTIYVEGLFLREESGSIKLKYFPDIYFEYEALNEGQENFSSKPPIDNNAELEQCYDEIAKKYPDEERRMIARLSLQYTKQWVEILKTTRNDSKELSVVQKDSLKRDCENFVIENVKKSKKVKARSAILSFVLLYIIIPSVVNWVVKKFLERFL